MYYNLYIKVFIMFIINFFTKRIIYIFDYALKNFYKLYYNLILININFFI